MKSPERYEGIERLIVAELKGRGLDRPGAEPRTPVLHPVVQRRQPEDLQDHAADDAADPLPVRRPRCGEVGDARRASPRIKAFSTGISPEKVIVGEHHAEAMERARKMGLLITPYTFRASAVGAGYADVGAEMRHYLRTLKVDGVITDNPDKMPR